MTTATDVEQIAARLVAAGHWVSADHRVDEVTAAALIGVTVRTLRLWRAAGTAPAFVRAGRLTYRISAVLEFLESRENRAA